MWLANHQLLMTTSDMIIEDPKLLDMLGIDLKKVEEDGLTPRS
jgi:retron-type reverse transcriptase